MQRLTLVRYVVKPGREEENAALVRRVFSQLREGSPPHIAYSVFRNGREFTHLFVNAARDDASELTELESFQAHAKDIGERCEAPPEQNRYSLQMLESYGVAAG